MTKYIHVNTLFVHEGKVENVYVEESNWENFTNPCIGEYDGWLVTYSDKYGTDQDIVFKYSAITAYEL